MQNSKFIKQKYKNFCIVSKVKSMRQKEYADSFKRASLDGEMKSIAEAGLGDYLEQLICLEK